MKFLVSVRILLLLNVIRAHRVIGARSPPPPPSSSSPMFFHEMEQTWRSLQQSIQIVPLRQKLKEKRVRQTKSDIIRHHYARRKEKKKMMSVNNQRNNDNTARRRSNSKGTKFLLHRPTEADAEQLFDKNVSVQSQGRSDEAFNVPFAGFTEPTLYGYYDKGQHHPEISKHLQELDESNVYQQCDVEKYTNDGGWRILCFRRHIGQGLECYTLARDMIMNWEKLHYGSDWAGIHLLKHRRRRGCCRQNTFEDLLDTPSSNVLQIITNNNTSSSPHRSSASRIKRLVTYSKINSFLWAMNPCSVIYEHVDERRRIGGSTTEYMTYSCSSYGTLKGHMLSGEERVSVLLRDCSNDVFMEVLSVSRPSSPGIFGKIMFHPVKQMQIKFFREQVDTVKKLIKGTMMNNNSSDNDNFFI